MPLRPRCDSASPPSNRRRSSTADLGARAGGRAAVRPDRLGQVGVVELPPSVGRPPRSPTVRANAPASTSAAAPGCPPARRRAACRSARWWRGRTRGARGARRRPAPRRTPRTPSAAPTASGARAPRGARTSAGPGPGACTGWRRRGYRRTSAPGSGGPTRTARRCAPSSACATWSKGLQWEVGSGSSAVTISAGRRRRRAGRGGDSGNDASARPRGGASFVAAGKERAVAIGLTLKFRGWVLFVVHLCPPPDAKAAGDADRPRRADPLPALRALQR